MKSFLEILKEGSDSQLKSWLSTEKKSMDFLNTPLILYNIRPISYAAVHGNLNILSFLINMGCDVSASTSDDCNLGVWSTLCENENKKLQIFNYLKSMKIFEKFSDGLKEEELEALLHNKFIIKSAGHLDEHTKRRYGRYHYIKAFHELKQGDLKQSLESALESAKYYKKIHEFTASDYRELSYIYNMLGNISYILALENTAKDTMNYYKEAIALREKILDKSLLDYDDIASFRRNLSSYMDNRELEENYFSRNLSAFIDENIQEKIQAKL